MLKRYTNVDPADSLAEEWDELPRDVGWILLITGLASELGMPGVPPFWIAGVMILWPETGEKLARPLRRRFPRSYGRMQGMIRRYVTDLKSRYP